MLNRFSTFWTPSSSLLLPTFVQVGTTISIGSSASDPVVSGYACAVSPGANRALLLPFATKQNSDSLTVTYNSVAGTQLAFNRYTTPTPDFVAAIYGWFGSNVPNDGTSHDFSIDTASAATFWGKPIEFINVANAADLRRGADALNGTAFSVALTSVVSTSLLVGAFIGGSTAAAPADTEQEFVDVSNTNNFAAYYKRPGTDHTGGSVTVGCTHASGNGNLVACELGMAA